MVVILSSQQQQQKQKNVPMSILWAHMTTLILVRLLAKNPVKNIRNWAVQCTARLKVGNKWDWTSVGGNWKHILLHLLIACICSHSSTRISVSTFFSQFEIQEPIGHPYSLLTQRTTVTQHMSQLGFNRFNISLKLLFQIFFLEKLQVPGSRPHFYGYYWIS